MAHGLSRLRSEPWSGRGRPGFLPLMIVRSLEGIHHALLKSPLVENELQGQVHALRRSNEAVGILVAPLQLEATQETRIHILQEFDVSAHLANSSARLCMQCLTSNAKSLVLLVTGHESTRALTPQVRALVAKSMFFLLLLVTSASLVVTSALLLVTRSY